MVRSLISYTPSGYFGDFSKLNNDNFSFRMVFKKKNLGLYILDNLKQKFLRDFFLTAFFLNQSSIFLNPKTFFTSSCDDLLCFPLFLPIVRIHSISFPVHLSNPVIQTSLYYNISFSSI